MLVDQHSDVSRLVWRYDRWHHEVDYRSFRKNKLILKDDLVISKSINNYGMKLVNIEDSLLEESVDITDE
jgi:hypothetical protein